MQLTDGDCVGIFVGDAEGTFVGASVHLEDLDVRLPPLSPLLELLQDLPNLSDLALYSSRSTSHSASFCREICIGMENVSMSHLLFTT